jgi:hypothetical protein
MTGNRRKTTQQAAEKPNPEGGGGFNPRKRLHEWGLMFRSL